jgi:hypothetical protein
VRGKYIFSVVRIISRLGEGGRKEEGERGSRRRRLKRKKGKKKQEEAEFVILPVQHLERKRGWEFALENILIYIVEMMGS